MSRRVFCRDILWYLTEHVMEDLKTTGQVKGINVRMPVEEWDKAQGAAEAECRSLSGHVRFLIRKDIEEREKAWSQ